MKLNFSPLCSLGDALFDKHKGAPKLPILLQAYSLIDELLGSIIMLIIVVRNCMHSVSVGPCNVTGRGRVPAQVSADAV